MIDKVLKLACLGRSYHLEFFNEFFNKFYLAHSWVPWSKYAYENLLKPYLDTEFQWFN